MAGAAAAGGAGGLALCHAQLLALLQVFHQLLLVIMHQAGITLDQLLGQP